MRCITMLSMAFLFVLFYGKDIRAKEDNIYSFGHFYYHYHEGYVSICGYLGRETEVVIPSSIAGKPVSEIESGSFNGCNTIEIITVPDTVVLVYEDSFTGSSSLKKIVTATVGITIKAGDGVSIEYVSDQGEAKRQEIVTDKKKDINEETGDNENTDVSTNIEIGDFVYEEDGEEYPEKRIIIPDSNLTLTVDENGNLVEIDTNGNVIILDNSRKYTLSENTDGTIRITGEDGGQVKVSDDGNIEIVSLAQSMDSEDTDANVEKKVVSLGGVVRIVAVLVFFTVIGVFLLCKKRGKNYDIHACEEDDVN